MSCVVPPRSKLRPVIFTVMVKDVAETTPDRCKCVDDLTLGEVINAKNKVQTSPIPSGCFN